MCDEIVRALALGLERDPARMAKVDRYLTALVNACNATEDGDGTQDALAMQEAVACLIAIQHAAMDNRHINGALIYIHRRVFVHVESVRLAGNGAQHIIEEEDDHGRTN